MTAGWKNVAHLVSMPARVEDLGISTAMAEDLFMRRVLTERATTVADVGDALCVGHSIADQLAHQLREKAHLEYLGANGRDYRIQLTEQGFRTTTQRLASGRHVGPMPVPLEQYQRVVKAQEADDHIDHESFAAAFTDLVLDDTLISQIGPAFMAGGAIFLYGPAGTGKTSIAERLNRLYNGPVFIPRYVETDGQVISVYDPALHHAVTEQPSPSDERWVLCERPLILVGGELDLSMLDLQFDRVSGISVAPIQLLANNGILVVDDFGRQAFRPEEILNRSIVPLSRGIDFLRSSTGSKFTVPFALKLVISTNLNPTSLGDDAFLRRLRNKVFVGPVTDTAFAKVCEDAAIAAGMSLGPQAISRLCAIARKEIGELRPYLGVDFCELAVAICKFDGGPRVMDVEMIDRVADLYFVRDAANEMSGRANDSWDGGAGNERPSGPEVVRYQIGGFAENPLEGLDALAETQSIDGQHDGDGVPLALQADSKRQRII